jgi:hypothetical membrane protein
MMNKTLCAWCGIAAPIVFFVAMVAFAFLTPGYSNMTNAVSELGMAGAPYALGWNLLGFVLVGLLVMAFAWGMRLDLRPGKGAVGVPLLIGLSGLGLAGAGLIPAEAGFVPSTATTLHLVMVAINFLPFLLASLFFAFRLRTHAYWKRLTLFSAAMGILAILTFLLPRTVPGGFSQRVGLGAYFLRLLVLGVALLRKQAAAPVGARAQAA